MNHPSQFDSTKRARLHAGRRRRHALSRLARDVSHDVRGILTVVGEYVSLLQDGLYGEMSEEQQQALGVLGVRTEALNHVVNDLTDWSKLHLGEMRIGRRSCQVSEIVKVVLPSLTRQAHVKGLSVVSDVPPDLPEVYGDPVLIGRAWLNLGLSIVKSNRVSGPLLLWANAGPNAKGVSLGVSARSPKRTAGPSSADASPFEPPPASRGGADDHVPLSLIVARKLIDWNLGQLTERTVDGEGRQLSFDVPVAEPQTVLRRYLDRFDRISRSSSISVASAAVGTAISSKAIPTAEAVLRDTLRPSDLIFRTGAGEWLLVFAGGPARIRGCQVRLAAARRETERRGFREAAPEISVAPLGTWATADGIERILMDIANLRTSQETHHGTHDSSGANDGNQLAQLAAD